MKYKDVLKRIEVAQAIFADQSMTPEKFKALQTLLKGIHPNIDAILARCTKEWERLSHIEKGEAIELVLEGLPEGTEKEKKRKKFLLLFLSAWKDLQKEVKRVQAELAKSSGDHPKQSKLQSWGNILGVAKGPLGFITILAVGWVALSATSVEISVENRGCDTMYPTSYANIPLPGISLPKEPILSGDLGFVHLPPLDLQVDGQTPGRVTLSALRLNYHFDIPTDVSLTFNGESLIGSSRDIYLRESKKHALVVQCR